MATLGSSTGRVLARRVQFLRRKYSSSFPTASSKLDDPGKLVLGLTPEQVDANPEIKKFLEHNFDDSSNEEDGDSGFVIPPEILKEYGITVEPGPKEEKVYGAPKVDLGLGTPEQQALNIRTLRTSIRTEEGSNACRRLRYDRMIPGMLHGGDPNKGINSRNADSKLMLKTPWPELQREMDRFHRQFESRVYDLTVYQDESDTEGTAHRVVPTDIQRHPIQGTIYCANFVRYHAGRPVKLPIVYINQEESPALKRDGFIVPVNKYVECFVEEGAPIPEKLELECTGVQLKDVLRMDRLIFPAGVRPTDRIDPKKFVIGPVLGGRGGDSDDTEEGDGEAEKEE